MKKSFSRSLFSETFEDFDKEFYKSPS